MIRIGIQPKMLDPDPNQFTTDRKHWEKSSLSYFSSFSTVEKEWELLTLQFSKSKEKMIE